MDTSEVTLFGLTADPQIFITALMLVLTVPIMLIQVYLNFRKQKLSIEAEKNSITNFLSKPEIIDKLSLSDDSVRMIIDHMRERDEALAKIERAQTSFGRLIDKIDWDVAGLIGMLVTIFILIMSISRLFDEIPDSIVAAWLTIIGYYFGKEARK